MVPVVENDHLIGMVTDRDLVLRALSQSRGLDTPIEDCITSKVLYCFTDGDLADVAAISSCSKRYPRTA